MKKKVGKPFVPEERHETKRREIIALLQTGTFSAKEISSNIGIPEKEVYDHLEHIRRSMTQKGGHLVITPSECLSCGFVFAKREKLSKPGKCPVCRSQHIREPLFGK